MTTLIGLILFGFALIFNAGGFIWLARNHHATADRRLGILEADMKKVLSALAHISGILAVKFKVN